MRQRIDREFAKQCVGAGWSGLIDELFDLLEAHKIEATQVKEKFGQLRVYICPAHEEVYDEINKIERRSSSICETCGAPSMLRTRGGWLKSICDSCKETLDVLIKTRK